MPNPAYDPPNSLRTLSAAISLLKSIDLTTLDLDCARYKAADFHARTWKTISAANPSALQAARASLHPVRHFVPYAATLHASLLAADPDSPTTPSLLADLRALVLRTDPLWVRAVPVVWVGAARHAVRLAVDANNPLPALALLPTLRTACEKLATRPDELVALHPDLLALTLRAKCYRAAAAWYRERRRLHVSPDRLLEATDVHLVYHYAAAALANVDDMRGALQCLRLALAVPAHAPGPFFAVALATFRRYLLVHLLETGKCGPQPKLSSYQAGPLRKDASEYFELAYACEKLDATHAQQIAESNRHVFEEHGNIALVKRALAAVAKRLLVRLSGAYVTIKLPDVAAKVGVPDEAAALRLLLAAIEQGTVRASIDERERVVHLSDDDGAMPPDVAVHMSSAYMAQCIEVMQRVERFREDIECDPEFVRREMYAQQGRKAGGGGGTPFGSSSGIALGGTELEDEFLR